MKELPILMKGPLVLQIFAGIKTNTRRTKDLENINECPDEWQLDRIQDGYPDGAPRFVFTDTDGEPVGIPCPYGGVGDHLWIRENWRLSGWQWDDAEQWFQYQADGVTLGRYLPEEEYEKWNDWLVKKTEEIFALPGVTWQDSEGNTVNRDDVDEAKCIWDKDKQPWKPSIHMPRWASRLTLEITDIRVERLQDISEEDAKAEGVEISPFGDKWHNYLCPSCPHDSAVGSFSSLWLSINGAGSWTLNPWVWALTFKVVPQ